MKYVRWALVLGFCLFVLFLWRDALPFAGLMLMLIFLFTPLKQVIMEG